MALKGEWNRNGRFFPTFKEQIISLFHQVGQGLENSEGLLSSFYLTDSEVHNAYNVLIGKN
jgi:hypothetical protein